MTRHLRIPTGLGAIVCAALAVMTLRPGGVVAQGMPDPAQMSGLPLPVAELAAGTVTVRVIRGSLANPIGGQQVELVGGATRLTATTNEGGRAEFTGVQPGTRVKAVLKVGSETIESREFAVPASGGIRMMLVARDPTAATQAAATPAPVQPGSVVLGEQSRFVFELGDEGLSVFNLFQIVNAGQSPVQPPAPVVFELPQGAEHATILEGSSPQAAVNGGNVEVKGPFAPGTTVVQIAYTMPYSGSDLTVQQKMPVGLSHLTVIAQKVGALHLASPQMAEHRDMAADGQTFIVGSGPALKAGEAVTFNFTGLPHHSTWPRTVALTLAVLILAGGAWSSLGRGGAARVENAARRKLETRRDRLFDELTALEAQHRERAIEPARYAERRRDLVSALERVYAELDEDAGVARAS